jgi:hypothetical protein
LIRTSNHHDCALLPAVGQFVKPKGVNTTMGNNISSNATAETAAETTMAAEKGTTTISTDHHFEDLKSKYRSFPGSAMLEKTFCGSIDTTDPTEYDNSSTVNRLLKRAEALCVSSPVKSSDHRKSFDEENSILLSPTSNDRRKKSKSTGHLLARALVSEVTDNPKTMTQAAMQQRERKLLKAAAAAAVASSSPVKQQHPQYHYQQFPALSPPQRKPVGVAAPPHVLRSMAFACTGDDDTVNDLCSAPQQDFKSVSKDAASMAANVVTIDDMDDVWADHPNVVTIGIALSRQAESSADVNTLIHGHPGTITRQTQYDFNQIQDRQYKYVSSCGPGGWRAGGAEYGQGKLPDETHIPIIRIHCPTESSVDMVITALASGEIFIPNIQILPEQLTVHNCSATGSTNLVVHFGCERNDDLPVEEWPNWCLEFLHNQLYDYFSANNGPNGGGAVWMKRPFSITLAKQVRWKTVKHMNRYFAASEKVISSWRDMGPQSLKPKPSHLEGGASAEEVTRPHGIYLYRGGVPTNYFSPNFEPPYSTKMTRSLLLTVLQKSWDKKRREWSSKPVPRVVEPTELLAAACGYSTDVGATGFMAHEATTVTNPAASTSVRRESPQVSGYNYTREPLSVVEFVRSASEDISQKENSEMDTLTTNPANKNKVPTPRGNHPSPVATNTLPKTIDKLHSPQIDDTDNNVSVAPSAFNASVAESGTTVLHTNSSKPQVETISNSWNRGTKSPAKNKQQFNIPPEPSTNGRRLYSDEDFLDDLSSIDTPPAVRNSILKSPRGAALAEEERHQSMRNPSSNEVTPKHQPLSVVRQSPLESPNSSPTKRAQIKLDLEKRAQKEQLPSLTNTAHRNAGGNFKIGSVEPTSSLEYSTDGSSAYFAPQDPMGVVQQSTKENLLQPLKFNRSEDDDESALLSIQESSSSTVSEIPTDEELFSVGWAKALDASSGNYYYFTLDRTRTVWDNPLSSSQWGGELPPPVAASTKPLAHMPIDP